MHQTIAQGDKMEDQNSLIRMGEEAETLLKAEIFNKTVNGLVDA